MSNFNTFVSIQGPIWQRAPSFSRMSMHDVISTRCGNIIIANRSQQAKKRKLCLLMQTHKTPPSLQNHGTTCKHSSCHVFSSITRLTCVQQTPATIRMCAAKSTCSTHYVNDSRNASILNVTKTLKFRSTSCKTPTRFAFLHIIKYRK